LGVRKRAGTAYIERMKAQKTPPRAFAASVDTARPTPPAPVIPVPRSSVARAPFSCERQHFSMPLSFAAAAPGGFRPASPLHRAKSEFARKGRGRVV